MRRSAARRQDEPRTYVQQGGGVAVALSVTDEEAARPPWGSGAGARSRHTRSRPVERDAFRLASGSRSRSRQAHAARASRVGRGGLHATTQRGRTWGGGIRRSTRPAMGAGMRNETSEGRGQRGWGEPESYARRVRRLRAALRSGRQPSDDGDASTEYGYRLRSSSRPLDAEEEFSISGEEWGSSRDGRHECDQDGSSVEDTGRAERSAVEDEEFFSWGGAVGHLESLSNDEMPPPRSAPGASRSDRDNRKRRSSGSGDRGGASASAQQRGARAASKRQSPGKRVPQHPGHIRTPRVQEAQPLGASTPSQESALLSMAAIAGAAAAAAMAYRDGTQQWSAGAVLSPSEQVARSRPVIIAPTPGSDMMSPSGADATPKPRQLSSPVPLPSLAAVSAATAGGVRATPPRSLPVPGVARSPPSPGPGTSAAVATTAASARAEEPAPTVVTSSATVATRPTLERSVPTPAVEYAAHEGTDVEGIIEDDTSSKGDDESQDAMEPVCDADTAAHPTPAAIEVAAAAASAAAMIPIQLPAKTNGIEPAQLDARVPPPEKAIAGSTAQPATDQRKVAALRKRLHAAEAERDKVKKLLQRKSAQLEGRLMSATSELERQRAAWNAERVRLLTENHALSVEAERRVPYDVADAGSSLADSHAVGHHADGDSLSDSKRGVVSPAREVTEYAVTPTPAPAATRLIDTAPRTSVRRAESGRRAKWGSVCLVDAASQTLRSWRPEVESQATQVAPLDFYGTASDRGVQTDCEHCIHQKSGAAGAPLLRSAGASVGTSDAPPMSMSHLRMSQRVPTARPTTTEPEVDYVVPYGTPPREAASAHGGRGHSASERHAASKEAHMTTPPTALDKTLDHYADGRERGVAAIAEAEARGETLTPEQLAVLHSYNGAVDAAIKAVNAVAIAENAAVELESREFTPPREALATATVGSARRPPRAPTPSRLSTPARGSAVKTKHVTTPTGQWQLSPGQAHRIGLGGAASPFPSPLPIRGEDGAAAFDPEMLPPLPSASVLGRVVQPLEPGVHARLVIEDYMWKRSNNFVRSWALRWFQLLAICAVNADGTETVVEATLRYYRAAESDQLLKAIDLADRSARLVDDEKLTGGRANCFELTHRAERVYLLRPRHASSSGDVGGDGVEAEAEQVHQLRHQWVNALNSAIAAIGVTYAADASATAVTRQLAHDPVGTPTPAARAARHHGTGATPQLKFAPY